MKSIDLRIGIYKVYKEMIIKYITNSLSSDNIKKFYIDYLKIYLEYNNGIPQSNYDNNKFCNSNCYGFALDIPTPDIFVKLYDNIEYDDFLLNPGFASFKHYAYSKNGMLENTLSDLTNLGIKYYASSINSPITHNGYKIAVLFPNNSHDIHFVRQNSDGTWSEKVGYSKIIRTFKIIEESLYIENDFYLDKVYEIVKPTTKIKI